MNKKLLCVLSSLLLVSTSHAASLGNTYDNKLSNNTNYKATRLLVSSNNLKSNYTTHTDTNEAGVSITQYVDNNTGKVFAVTWSGSTLPNLEDILGQYFQEYVNNNNVKSLHANSVQDSDLVVKNSGHVRAFKGIAYLKSLVPANVNIQDIY